MSSRRNIYNTAATGEVAPEFALATDENREWRLSDHIGNVVVLLFYPQNETFVCNKQLCSVRNNWHNYLETRAVIVGISPGTPEEHHTFSNKLKLPIPLLADPGREVTALFGKHSFFPLSWTRAVVVIDAHGIVRNRNVMLRAFRPSDDQVITDIYEARGDALNEKYQELKQRIHDSII